MGTVSVRKFELWKGARLATGLLILLIAGAALLSQLARYPGPATERGQALTERPLTRTPNPAYLSPHEAKARHERDNPAVPWSGFLVLLSPNDRWKLRDLGDSNPPAALTAEERSARERKAFWTMLLTLGQRHSAAADETDETPRDP